MSTPTQLSPVKSQRGINDETRHLIQREFGTPTENMISQRLSTLAVGQEQEMQYQQGGQVQFQYRQLSISDQSPINPALPSYASFNEVPIRQDDPEDPFFRTEVLEDPIIRAEVLEVWGACLQSIETDEDAASEFGECVVSAQTQQFRLLHRMVFQWLQMIKAALLKKYSIELNEELVWTLLEKNGQLLVTWKNFLIRDDSTMDILLRGFLIDLDRHLNIYDPDIQARILESWLEHVQAFAYTTDAQPCLAASQAGDFTLMRNMAIYWIQQIIQEVARDFLGTIVTEEEVWGVLVEKKQLKGSWERFQTGGMGEIVSFFGALTVSMGDEETSSS